MCTVWPSCWVSKDWSCHLKCHSLHTLLGIWECHLDRQIISCEQNERKTVCVSFTEFGCQEFCSIVFVISLRDHYSFLTNNLSLLFKILLLRFSVTLIVRWSFFSIIFDGTSLSRRTQRSLSFHDPGWKFRAHPCQQYHLQSHMSSSQNLQNRNCCPQMRVSKPANYESDCCVTLYFCSMNFTLGYFQMRPHNLLPWVKAHSCSDC